MTTVLQGSQHLGSLDVGRVDGRRQQIYISGNVSSNVFKMPTAASASLYHWGSTREGEGCLTFSE